MYDVNRELVSKFLRRNDVKPDFKNVESILDSIKKEYISLSPKVKSNQKSLISQGLSSNKESISSIVENAPVLREINEVEVKWIIKKIATRLYDEGNII